MILPIATWGVMLHAPWGGVSKLASSLSRFEYSLTPNGFRTIGAVLDEVLTGITLGQDRGFQVPEFQRSYEWSVARQVEWLWADVARIYQRRVNGGDPYAEHFAGTILVGMLGSGGESRFAAIIDGQQRIITLTLLLAAIRDAVRGSETPEDARESVDMIQKRLFLNTDKQVARVRPQPEDQDDYTRVMLGESLSNQSSKVAAAYRHFVRLIAAGPDQTSASVDDAQILNDEPGADVDQYSDVSGDIDAVSLDIVEAPGERFDLRELTACVLHGLRFVLIADMSPSMYFEVFESLNHKGLPLSQASLIRNGIAMRCEDSGVEGWAKRWADVENSLPEGKSGLMESFLHTYVLRQGRNCPRGETYRELMALLDEQVAGGVSMRAAVQALFDDGAVFATMLSEVDYPEMRFLMDWGAAPAYPLLLDARLRLAADQIDTSAYRSVLAAVESLLVRRFISGCPPNDLRSAIGRVLVKVNAAAPATKKEYLELLDQQLRDPRMRWPVNEKFRRDVVERPIWEKNKSTYAGLVLLGLAAQIGGDEVFAKVTLGKKKSDYSVEHVYPQKPARGWAAELRRWKANPGQMKLRLHRLGNLTLTIRNSEYSNSPFTDKRRRANDKDSIKLSDEIWKRTKWDPREVDARGRLLAAKAIERWPYGVSVG